MMAVHHRTIAEIVAKELLFVGHANLDGFDHTAVAKPGIDRLVQEAKKNGRPVVYWVSKEYRIGTQPTVTLTTRSSARDKSMKSASTPSGSCSPVGASCSVCRGTLR
jgi:hypothetical protein